jgi:very-short-patch-repair endonuclease
VIWKFRIPSSGPIDITVPSRSKRSRPGIRVHFTRTLHSLDVRSRDGLPLTAPARTLIDVAEILPSRDLERAYEEAQIQAVVRPAHLRDALQRSSGRRGASAIRKLLAQKVEPALTRSEAERRVLALLRSAEIDPTATNARVGPYEVDFLWSAHRLIVEVDGYAYHSSRDAFERDRERDATLQAAGYRVIRLTWRQVHHRPEAVIARLAQALAGPSATNTRRAR